MYVGSTYLIGKAKILLVVTYAHQLLNKLLLRDFIGVNQFFKKQVKFVNIVGGLQTGLLISLTSCSRGLFVQERIELGKTIVSLPDSIGVDRHAMRLVLIDGIQIERRYIVYALVVLLRVSASDLVRRLYHLLTLNQ